MQTKPKIDRVWKFMRNPNPNSIGGWRPGLNDWAVKRLLLKIVCAAKLVYMLGRQVEGVVKSKKVVVRSFGRKGAQ